MDEKFGYIFDQLQREIETPNDLRSLFSLNRNNLNHLARTKDLIGNIPRKNTLAALISRGKGQKTEIKPLIHVTMRQGQKVG